MDQIDKDQELAYQADSLMHKAARPSTESVDDRNIPLLTELVDSPTTEAASGDRGAGLLRAMSDGEIDMLSHDIFQRVTERIDRELAGKLEARLAQEINAKVRVAVANVLIDMRQTIANEIGDAVNAALADKLR